MHLAELPSESELGEVDISRWLMTRRNVASYDCRSDVSAGLPGIAYVTHPRTVRISRAYAEETLLRKKTSEEKHYPPLCKVHGNKPTIIASHSWRY